MRISTPVGRRVRARRLALIASTILATVGAGSVKAQTAPPAPVRQSQDRYGVDLFLGTLTLDSPALTIGPAGPQGLSYYHTNRAGASADNMVASLDLVGSVMTVSIGNTSDAFNVSGTTYTATQGNGATLTFDSGTNIFTYTRSDGTVAHFDKNLATPAPFYASSGRITDILQKSGAKLTYAYDSADYCTHTTYPKGEPPICTKHQTTYRIRNITSSFGYRISFTYYLYSFDPDSGDYSTAGNWSNVISASVSNLSAGGSAIATQAFGTSYVGGTYFNFTDSIGRVTRYNLAPGKVVGIKHPGFSSDDVTIAYNGSGKVASITDKGVTTTYTYTDLSGIRTTTVTNALSQTTTYTFDIATSLMKTMTDAQGHQTAWIYDGSGRVTRTTYPEGNYVNYTYDARGNATEIRTVAKSGSGLADIVTTAAFDLTCGNIKTCNQPNTTTDARGAVTNYTYDATHGGVTSVTAPAPSVGAIRPQKRYSYTALQAYFDRGSGIVASGEPVYQLTGVSSCQTTASCAGAADEVVTTIGYGPQVAGTGNNLLPVSISKGSGDGVLTATTSATYNDRGDLTTVDGPLSGAADTTTFRYNSDRERVGVISPDPDGAGPLKRRAVKTSYNGYGLVLSTESGTVNGTTDTDWSAFVSLQQFTPTYDANARKVADTLTASGVTYGVTQYSYDAAGRLDCAATRMNTAAWGSLPASACALQAAGGAGPDRVTKYAYDAVDRPTKITTAYGTADASDDAAVAYTGNGKQATVTDARGNVTSYAYDGFDRLSRTCFQVTTSAACAGTPGDYEQLGYDAQSNITSRRLRDGTSIGYYYDYDNRLSYKTFSNGEPTVYYWLDLQNRFTQISSSANTTTFGYDALGRLTSDNQAFGGMSYQYDAAGRRTRETWSDGFYVTYDYNAAGSVTAIRENGSALLASYGYDDLGRRTGLTLGNGAVTSYGYDGASRLTSLTNDLAGTGQDLTVGLAYNPADQIISRTASNDGYAYTGAYNVDRSYGVNGLNQLISAGATSLGYDARGNLTSSGSTAYSYTSENRMKTGAGAALYYDDLGRLIDYNPGVSTRMFYAGGEIAAEVANPSGAILRRYVRGPGDDQPVVWYEGSGTSDRRYLVADERGSIVAVTDPTGAATAINRYDEFGIPQSGNVGRFQYTGQAWLPDVGLAYYKARMYSPTLGRFMQTDPIGYADGVNWYNYVGSDPVNKSDPLGLSDIIVTAPSSCYTFACQQNINELRNSLDRQSGQPGGERERDGDTSDSTGSEVTVTAKKPQNDIVVVARRTTRLPNVLPRTLWNHFLDGSGDTVCLTRSQFSDLASAGRRVGNLAPRAGGGYAQQTSYYGGGYANSFGTATLYLDGDRNPTGFHDFYNFDAHGRTSASAQVKTAIGALGYLAGGKDFSVDYNNGDCR